MRRAGLAGAGFASVCSLFLAACRVPPPDLSPDPGALLAAVRARQLRLQRVAGTATLRLDGPGTGPGPRGAARALLAAEKPDRLRVEVLDFFGNPALSLAAAGGRFLLHDVKSGRWIRGPAAGAALGAILPGLPPLEELVAALCGSAVLLPGEPVGAAAGDGQRELRISDAAGGAEQRVAVGPGAAVLGARTLRRGVAGNPEPAGPVAFGRFRTLGTTSFPAEVELSGAGTRLTIRWGDDLVLNGEPDPAPFALVPPPATPVEEWDQARELPLALPPAAPE